MRNFDLNDIRKTFNVPQRSNIQWPGRTYPGEVVWVCVSDKPLWKKGIILDEGTVKVGVSLPSKIGEGCERPIYVETVKYRCHWMDGNELVEGYKLDAGQLQPNNLFIRSMLYEEQVLSDKDWELVGRELDQITEKHIILNSGLENQKPMTLGYAYSKSVFLPSPSSIAHLDVPRATW